VKVQIVALGVLLQTMEGERAAVTGEARGGSRYISSTLYLKQTIQTVVAHSACGCSISGCEGLEAALANNQCTLAMALLGPFARHLLAGRTAKGFN
jgi:hypothetical protein